MSLQFINSIFWASWFGVNWFFKILHFHPLLGLTFNNLQVQFWVQVWYVVSWFLKILYLLPLLVWFSTIYKFNFWSKLILRQLISQISSSSFLTRFYFRVIILWMFIKIWFLEEEIAIHDCSVILFCFLVFIAFLCFLQILHCCILLYICSFPLVTLWIIF